MNAMRERPSSENCTCLCVCMLNVGEDCLSSTSCDCVTPDYGIKIFRFLSETLAVVQVHFIHSRVLCGGAATCLPLCSVLPTFLPPT